MEFRVLGQLRIRTEGGWITPTGALQRLLMSALLVRRNRPVALDVLIDEMWGGENALRLCEEVDDPRAEMIRARLAAA